MAGPAFCFNQVRARRGQRRLKVEPPAFYFNMLRYPFVSGHGMKAPLLTLLFVVTQVVTAVGFLWQKMVNIKVVVS